MKISIGMATYNGARYLQEQLDSFGSQTRLPDELVVCDDCSSDETVRILERFQRRAPFAVRIICNAENLGCTQNFGKAIGLCRGDIIFLSDQDDVWFPNKLTTVEKVMGDAADRLFVVNDVEIVDHALKPMGFTVRTQNRAFGLKEGYFNPGCCIAFRANLRSLILPIPNQANGHDFWINTIMMAVHGSLSLDSPLQYGRRHEGNASRWMGDGKSLSRWIAQFASLTAKTSLSNYADRGDALEILVQRLIDLGPDAYGRLGATRPLMDAVSMLECERDAVAQRLRLLEASWSRRKIMAVSMWLKGDYRHFNGWRSFLKDMLC